LASKFESLISKTATIEIISHFWSVKEAIICNVKFSQHL